MERSDASRGTARRSAQNEADRRRANQSLLSTVLGDRRATRSWERGARGERRVGKRLDRLAQDGVVVLHDRRRPGTRANIDHIVVSPRGVWVIDTKNYRGTVERRDVGVPFRRDLRLYVAGRDRSKLIESAVRQAADVRRALPALDVAVTPTLCFTHNDWSFPARPFVLDGVLVCWPRRLARTLRRPGNVSPARRDRIADLLADRFPSAT
jgi:hypothetical protein